MLSTKKLLYKILVKLNRPIVKETKGPFTITWASTSNPFCEHSFNIAKDGYTPIAICCWCGGTGSSTIGFGTCCLNGNTVQFNARMFSYTPASTTQNTVAFVVTYLRNDWL